jgi:hypothetical protein
MHNKQFEQFGFSVLSQTHRQRGSVFLVVSALIFLLSMMAYLFNAQQNKMQKAQLSESIKNDLISDIKIISDQIVLCYSKYPATGFPATTADVRNLVCPGNNSNIWTSFGQIAPKTKTGFNNGGIWSYDNSGKITLSLTATNAGSIQDNVLSMLPQRLGDSAVYDANTRTLTYTVKN